MDEEDVVIHKKDKYEVNPQALGRIRNLLYAAQDPKRKRLERDEAVRNASGRLDRLIQKGAQKKSAQK